MTRYGMAIDKTKCIGCKTCLMACKVSNNLPKDVWYSRLVSSGDPDVADSAQGTYPDISMDYYTIGCQHCDNPACVGACPTGASYVDEASGTVQINGDDCIGCKACIQACPYDVRTLIDSEPEYYLDHAVGVASAPDHKFGVVEKCTFCKNLIDAGEEPACMQLCPGRARWWGDIDDPNSELSKFLAERDYDVLEEDAGTKPRVFYLK